MKRFATLTVLIAIVFLLAQCSPKTKTATTSTSTTTTKTTTSPAYSADDIAAGKLVFESSCARCHKLKMPETHTPGEWDHILPSMSRKANLNETQASQVHAYVYTNAKAQ